MTVQAFSQHHRKDTPDVALVVKWFNTRHATNVFKMDRIFYPGSFIPITFQYNLQVDVGTV